MNERGKSRKSGRRWFGLRDVIYLAVIAAGIVATRLPAKFKRGVKETFAPPAAPSVAPERDEVFRQAEARIRAELEAKYERDIAALKKSLAEQPKREPENLAAGPPDVEIGTVTDVRKLRSGIPFKSTVDIGKGGLASKERVDEASYTANYQLSLRVPAPAKTMVEIEAGNPGLSKILPGLPPLIEKAQVSSWFNKLYENKVSRVRRDANTLNELLTKHNVYDCQTILQFQAANGRRLFFLQAEMDVVSDGSDGDRLPSMPDDIVNSPNYQPFTSYGWPKKSETPNPMIAGYDRRIAAGQKELEASSTTAERKMWLRERIRVLKRGIEDLKSRSFLIADYDPFIVLPVNILGSSDAYAPDIGDFAVVIHGNRLYPAIVGDGGPEFKVGEGSLRLAREINTKATSYNRPVSDLKVGYLIFPGSRDAEKGPPDYERWRQRCHELLGEIGGVGEGYQLHQWQDLLPKVPAPAPAPVPDPSKPLIPSGAPQPPSPPGVPSVGPAVPPPVPPGSAPPSPPVNPVPTSGGAAPGPAPGPP